MSRTPLKAGALLLGLFGLGSTVQADMPNLTVLLVKTTQNQEQTKQTLGSLSVAGNERGYIFPARSSSKELLSGEIAAIEPKVLAETDYPASSTSGTAIDLHDDGHVTTVRIKGMGITGERFRMWLGIQLAESAAGPLEIKERIAIQSELAYGEALVTPAREGLLVIVIPGPFDPEPLPTDGLVVGNEIPLMPVDEQPKIIWDAQPGTVLPDIDVIRNLTY